MTDLLPPPVTILPPRARARSYLFGKYSRAVKTYLVDWGYWDYIDLVPRDALTTPPGNVIATETTHVQRLLGDDVTFWSLHGSAVTDGTRWIFVADETVGRRQWDLWGRAVYGNVDGMPTSRLDLLPEICARCGRAWWWDRDARGVGWCRGCVS